jgi:hypothetical protein
MMPAYGVKQLLRTEGRYRGKKPSDQNLTLHTSTC